MQSRLYPVLLIAALVPLAGCLGGDDTDGGSSGGSQAAVAEGEFYSGVPYDPSAFDLDSLSQPVYKPLPVEEVWVTMSDGKRINTGVYRPDTDAPTPVFINFSPYHGDKATARGDHFAQYLIDDFVPRGYTIVLASIRGTGHSEGCFEVGSDREAQDLNEVVDHFSKQPWSNGNVGAGGKSYDSTTQNGMIAKFPHPALKGIFHVSGITDMYRYTFHDGVMARADAAAFTGQYSLGQGTHEYGNVIGAGAEDASSDDEDLQSLARLADDAACAETPENVVNPVGSAGAGAKTEYWVERDWTRYIGGSDWQGSIFFYHGLQDWNVEPDNILPWLENLPDGISTKVWLHQNTYNLGHVYPMRTDWNLTMLRWLDQTLKGIDTGILDGPRFEVEGTDGIWRASAEWPVEETDLAVEDGIVATADAYALRLSGAPTLSLAVTATTEDPVVSVVLYDESPDGAREWVGEAVLRLLYRDSLETPSPVVPLQSYDVSVRFYPLDAVLEPGHRWVLGFGDAPVHSVPLPGQVEGLSYDTGSVVLTAAVTDAAVGTLADQPVPMGCIAC